MTRDTAADSPDDARKFDGAQKAAAILLAMGKPPATRLLKHFESQELREVTRAAAQLGAVSMAALESLVEEFTSEFSTGANLLGDVGQAREMLTDAVPPEQVADIMSDVFGGAGANVWKAMGSVPEAVLSAHLGNEHPLTASFILSKLEPSLAAQIVTHLPREMRNEVLCAMISRPALSEEAQRIIEDAVRNDLATLAARASGLDSHTRIADIINNLEPLEAREVMQRLMAARPKEARIVMKMLFSFDDLPRLSQRARATLFDKLTTEVVVLALRGTDAEFRDIVLSSMASRARRLVEGELATASSAPPHEIAKARKQIVDLVLKMAQRNEIEISPPEGVEAA
ncbi:MAG TPA: FliG C-terminal domain-containing protein [Roseiarcus sp.]|nr:FliG C-terminal domain-containing protein [Roseiarcus sp.]